MTKDELYQKIKSIMVNEFEVEEDKVLPDAKDFIPVKIDPEIFRTVRTMQDVVDTLYPYTQQ